jgi:hypothetical protein
MYHHFSGWQPMRVHTDVHAPELSAILKRMTTWILNLENSTPYHWHRVYRLAVDNKQVHQKI